ncbi:MAG: nucleotidyl transferase AbiEii/AbiGii toxin family protein [Ignavibacteriae bacterium]|nr:MAG: nucleotidyl transferase AbiEii/AbiGii toxin family protein [Ignavibacteriota bacterium]
MLSISEIEKYYPENQKPFKRNLLREFLQYKILFFLFDSKNASKLSFIGGSALKILYGNNRFSEDLDFDNFQLTESQFAKLSEVVKNGLEAEGYSVEINIVYKKAFRCNIKFPKLLFNEGLSGYISEKILIQLDTDMLGFDYKPERKIINKFDIFTEIFVTPLDILLSQKIYSALNRKTHKGRDFFDIVFLKSLTKPNYDYLKFKLDIDNPFELKQRLMDECSKINFKTLANDLRPFLINGNDIKKIELFEEYIRTVEF